ncbi:MAG: hypothetical protein Q9164_005480 [Protoblastenia rupestris]
MTNTGIPSDVIRESEVWSSKFFHQDLQKKAKVLNVPSPNPQRGWSFKGAESTSRLGKLDLDDRAFLTDEKEHFDVRPLNDKAYPNKWNEDDLPGLQEFTTNFYDHCQTLCLQIMAAIEVSLGLASGSLQERYFGLITLLFQDTQGGLQYEDRGKEGTFLNLMRETEDEVAVNISNTFQRWSNDFFPAGVHQVWLPPLTEKQQAQKDYVLAERQSTVFFFKASWETPVGALPDFVTAGRSSRYEDITALNYHKQMTGVSVKNALEAPA